MKQEKPIDHWSDDPRCTCRPCPRGRDDMFWYQDESLACEKRYEEKLERVE